MLSLTDQGIEVARLDVIGRYAAKNISLDPTKLAQYMAEHKAAMAVDKNAYLAAQVRPIESACLHLQHNSQALTMRVWYAAITQGHTAAAPANTGQPAAAGERRLPPASLLRWAC